MHTGAGPLTEQNPCTQRKGPHAFCGSCPTYVQPVGPTPLPVYPAGQMHSTKLAPNPRKILKCIFKR